MTYVTTTKTTVLTEYDDYSRIVKQVTETRTEGKESEDDA